MGTLSDPLLAILEKTPDGVRLGDCILVEKLGAGGMGAVYLGHHLNFDLDVAVKVLPFHVARAHSTAVARFQKEARSMVRMDHPNIVRVFDVDEERGLHYLVMEFVDGDSAEARLAREGPLPERDALEIAVATAEALAAAHSHGFVHRDVKPANVLIRFRDGRVKLADLGLAKALAGEAREVALTATGQMLGTPAYMSPEQAEDASRADERSDVYSLGATLYALLSGRAPFEASQLFSLLLKVTRDEPEDLRSLRPGLTDKTVETVTELMTKSPTGRPRTMKEAVGLLRGCLEAAPGAGARGLARREMAGKRKATITGDTAAAGPAVDTAAAVPVDATAGALIDVTADMPEQTASVPPPAPEPLSARTAATADLPAAPGRDWIAAIVVGIVAAAVVAIVAIFAWRGEEPGQTPAAGEQESEVRDLLAAARSLQEQGFPEKAQEKLAEVLSLAPENEEAKRELEKVREEIARREGEAGRAAAYRKWMDKALELKFEGRLLEAEEAYRKAAEFELEGPDKARVGANEARARALLDPKLAARAIENSNAQELDSALAGLSSGACDSVLRVLPPEKVPERLSFRHTLLTRGWGELKGHEKYIRSVAFSPDGRFVAAGAWDSKAIMWEAATGRKVRTFEVEDSSLMYVAFSPDGRSLATAGRRKKGAGYSGELVVWDVQTGERLKTIEGSKESLSYPAFSPDGRRLAAARSWKERGTRKGDAVMWDAELWTVQARFDADSHRIGSVAFSPDGQHIATAHGWYEGDKGFGNAVLWDASTGEKLTTFERDQGRVQALAFSPDGRFIATGSADNTAALWEAASGVKLRVFKGHEGERGISSVVFSLDGRFIVTGAYDNVAILWNASTGEKVRTFEGHAGSVSSVRFSPDGRHLATGSSDQTVRIWILPEELRSREE